MKIAVLNFSGNVGKTTVAKHLLAPRLVDGDRPAPIISVETINDDAGADARVKARHFRDIYEKIELADNLILDIGASNVEEFVSRMIQHDGSHEAIDCFVVPVTPETKQQKDTVATVKCLSDLGIPPEKIHVVFNRVTPEDEVGLVFSAILRFASEFGVCKADPDVAILGNEVYDLLRTDPNLSGSSVSELAEMNPDVERDKARVAAAAGDEIAKRRALNYMAAIRLSRSACRNLDQVFNRLVGNFGTQSSVGAPTDGRLAA